MLVRVLGYICVYMHASKSVLIDSRTRSVLCLNEHQHSNASTNHLCRPFSMMIHVLRNVWLYFDE